MQPGARQVQVAFLPTLEDHLALFQVQVLDSLAFRVTRISSVTLAVVLTAAASLWGDRSALAGALLIVLLAGAAIWGVPEITRRAIIRRFEAAEPPRVEYRVDEVGVHGRSAWAAWNDVTRVKETREAFFVWMRPGAGAYLPKRALAEGEVALLRALFETYAGGRARLGSDSPKRS